MRIITVLALIIATLWLAGNLLLVGIAAPTLFAHAPGHAAGTGTELSRALAGLLFGDLLQNWVTVVDVSLWLLVLVLLGGCAGAALRARRTWLAVACVGALIALSAAHLGSRATLRALAAQRPPVPAYDSREQPPAEPSDEQRALFNTLHHRSVTLFGLETVLLLAVVVGLAIALARREREDGASAPRAGA